MFKFALILVVLIIQIQLQGCSERSQEEIVSRYPSGKKLETGIYVGDKTNRNRLKSFEYYETGEIKKEFSHKDNHFFGPWTFWYRNGTVLAKGEITAKTMTHENAVGSGTYFWPAGDKMIEIIPSANQQGTSIQAIFDEKGTKYSPETAPVDLNSRIKSLLDQWQEGKI